jgi:hypothetical protein
MAVTLRDSLPEINGKPDDDSPLVVIADEEIGLPSDIVSVVYGGYATPLHATNT